MDLPMRHGVFTFLSKIMVRVHCLLLIFQIHHAANMKQAPAVSHKQRESQESKMTNGIYVYMDMQHMSTYHQLMYSSTHAKTTRAENSDAKMPWPIA